MLSPRLALTSLSVLLAVACDRPEKAPSEGAARPLPFESGSAVVLSDAAPRPGLGCEPGRHRCSGEKLEACDPLRGWIQVNVCQTAAHCNGKLRQCLVDACVLGEHQCDGRFLQQCQANGWTTVRECARDDECDAEHGICR
jgi:hypothetical protein